MRSTAPIATLLAAVAMTGCASTEAGGSTSEEHSAASTETTSPANEEAPALERGPATGDAAHECGHGTTSNSHTSCAFAEKVRFSFAGTYGSTNKPPATITAYSPTTNREYTLHCFQVARSLIECTTGTAAVVFPSPSSSTSTPEPSGEKDEVGSTSHATDEQFCEERTCIGSFTTEGGTVVECSDGTYSHAGGISGACSHHGGESGSSEPEEGESHE